MIRSQSEGRIMSRWVKVLICLTIPLGVVQWILYLEPTILSVGYAPLTINFRPTTDRPIRAVTVEAVNTLEDAESACQYALPPESPSRSAEQRPFVGQPLRIEVMTTSRRTGTLLPRERHGQLRYLVVIVEYEDGERKGTLVNIPDLRKSRTVTVVLP